MSHDSGFRRGDHDSSHRAAVKLRGHTKASDQLEERMRRRQEQSDRMRRLLKAKKAEEEGADS